jgi:single-strand DNA-binding protein
MKSITVTGRLTRDAEEKGSGNTFLAFPVAVNDGYGESRTTIFFDCVTYQSKLKPYLTKGQSVAVSGEFTVREYNNKTYLGIRSNSIDLLGSRQHKEHDAQPKSSDQRNVPQSRDIDDEIPF